MVTWYGYRCDYCGKWFIRWNRYISHVSLHAAVVQAEFWKSILDAYARHSW